MGKPQRLVLSLGAVLLCACPGDAPDNPSSDAAVGADANTSADGAGADAMNEVTRRMFVSTGNAQVLAVIDLMPDGTMAPQAALDLNLGGNTGAMTVDAEDELLHIGVADAIATVSITGGTPALVGTTPGTGVPTYISISDDGNFLVSAYFGEGRIKSHTIAATPPFAEADSLLTAVQPHLIIIDGPLNYAYVPHRDGQTVQWFSQSAAGAFTFVDEVLAVGAVGPRHMVFSSDDAWAYVVNEQGDSVSAYTVEADGSLTFRESISTLAGGVPDPNNNCADIHITPDDQFLYASNRGDDSIAMFAVGADGLLTSLGQQTTEATPREFSMSPSGRHIVVAGQGTGFLESFAIQGDGTLMSVDRYETGGDPRWIYIEGE